MKKYSNFIILIIALGLLAQACKKETGTTVTPTPTPTTPKVNNLVGTWDGIELYKVLVNDTLTYSNTRNFKLVLNEDYSGTHTLFSLNSPMPCLWTNAPGKVGLTVRFTSATIASTVGYYFDIKDSTATTQKWYQENISPDASGRRQRIISDWQLTKK
jgi:hypothetical protein